MFSLTVLTLIVLVIASSAYIIVHFNDKRVLLLHLILLFITPWAINLLLSRPTLIEYILAKPSGTPINLFADLASTDYLFFKSIPKLKYAVGSYGYFLPSFLPIIVIGLWNSFGNKKQRTLLIAFLASVISSILLVSITGYFAFAFSLMFLSLFATIGVYIYLDTIRSKNTWYYIKLLIGANFLLIFYEVLRLFHSINVQMTLKL